MQKRIEYKIMNAAIGPDGSKILTEITNCKVTDIKVHFNLNMVFGEDKLLEKN